MCMLTDEDRAMTRAEAHEMWKRMAEASKRRDAAAHGPTTPDPEPPGGGLDWECAFRNEAAFAVAGLCETWRMDQGAKTSFFRYSDFPPGFNFTGLWWRKA